jgi:hypothetical protein
LRERDGDACLECGEFLDFTNLSAIHVDHRWPRKLGGDDRIANLGLLHERCNKLKGDRVDERLTSWARSAGLLCAGLHGYRWRVFIEVPAAHSEGRVGVAGASVARGGGAGVVHAGGARVGDARTPGRLSRLQAGGG